MGKLMFRLILLFFMSSSLSAAELGPRFINCVPPSKDKAEAQKLASRKIWLCNDTYLPAYVTDNRVIVKYLPKDKLGELNILEKTRHLSRAIKLLDKVKVGGEIYAVLEYGHGGDVHGLIERAAKRNSPVRNARIVFREAMNALFEFHQNHFAHLDVKAENFILVRRLGYYGYIVKIADFDTSEYLPPKTTPTMSIVGTYRSMAPEIYNANLWAKIEQRSALYNPFKADIWSAGIMLFQLLTKGSLYKIPSNVDNHYRLLRRFGIRSLINAYKLPVEDGAIKLLERMLNQKPEKRPSIEEVLKDPWLNGVETAPAV